MEIIIITVIGIVVSVTLVLALLFGGQLWALTVQPPIEIKVDNKIVYSGSAACVDVISSGATTRVDIDGGFLCLFPIKYYVSNNVQAK